MSGMVLLGSFASCHLADDAAGAITGQAGNVTWKEAKQSGPQGPLKAKETAQLDGLGP